MPVPRDVPPSKKVTVPVAAVGTAAVNVTDWLTVDGFTEDVSETVGVVFPTDCVRVPVAELLFPSPL